MDINPIESLVWYVAFVFSATLHEAGHAWAAKVGGDLTAYLSGQVTLDPIPHMRREPIGMVVVPLISLFIIGFPLGFASAPYDPLWAARHPRRAAWMSLAGPGANLVLVMVTMAVMWVGLSAGLLKHPGSASLAQIVTGAEPGLWTSASLLLSVFFSLNLILFTFNLFPLPPLDGAGALPLILKPGLAGRYQDLFRSVPMAGFIGLFVAWKLFPVVFFPVLRFAVDLVYW